MRRPYLPVLVLVLALHGQSRAQEPKHVDVINQVQGQTTIFSLVKEGTEVKKGQIIGKLDPGALRDNELHQRITTAEANLNLATAGLARNSALINARVVRDSSDRDAKSARKDAAIAKTKIARAKVAIENATTNDEVASAEAARVKAETALEAAREALRILEEETRPRQTREAKAILVPLEADFRAKTEMLTLEEAKEAKLHKQLEACTLLAPADGKLLYGEAEPKLKEGSIVRERQLLFRIVAE